MMELFNRSYVKLVLFHVILGILFYILPSLSKIYGILIFFIGLYVVVKTKNKNNEVLLIAAYIVGSEVILRMTGGSLLYEFSKYGVIIFLALGMYYTGFSKNSVPYWFYTLLLIPGIIVAADTLNLTSDMRTLIAFNISGPACLGVASIYCYNRPIGFSRMNEILLAMFLPIIATSVYILLYTPDLKEALTGTDSNFETSGGFGPNQVATILGMGVFIAFTRLIFNSKTTLLIVINSIIIIFITYRGLLTFSRGGMITAFIMIPVLLFFIYLNTKKHRRFKLGVLLGAMLVAFLITWLYTSDQTGGLIDKRYANKDALGRVKESRLSGREEIWDSEINAFLEHPFLGIGVGKSTEYREGVLGYSVLSHNEISRTLAEHGTLGIIALMIVFFTPIFLYLDNKQHLYMFCFLFFWLLTINHAAMRIAAPAFVYSLSLLKVTFDKNSFE